MVQIPPKIKRIINRYLEELERNSIPIREAMLFGSYANGNYNEWSDIDIALVSEIFSGNWIDDKDKIRKTTLSVSSQIEAMPFSPSDFNEHHPLAKEILATGMNLRHLPLKEGMGRLIRKERPRWFFSSKI